MSFLKILVQFSVAGFSSYLVLCCMDFEKLQLVTALSYIGNGQKTTKAKIFETISTEESFNPIFDHASR